MSFVCLSQNGKKLILEEVDFLTEEELEIIFIKWFDVESHIKGCQAYMNEWTPEIDKLVKNRISGIRTWNSWESKQRKLRLFCSTFYLLSAHHGSTSEIEVWRRRANLSDG